MREMQTSSSGRLPTLSMRNHGMKEAMKNHVNRIPETREAL
jgi:hypothetical protein